MSIKESRLKFPLNGDQKSFFIDASFEHFETGLIRRGNQEHCLEHQKRHGKHSYDGYDGIERVNGLLKASHYLNIISQIHIHTSKSTA